MIRRFLSWCHRILLRLAFWYIRKAFPEEACSTTILRGKTVLKGILIGKVGAMHDSVTSGIIKGDVSLFDEACNSGVIYGDVLIGDWERE